MGGDRRLIQLDLPSHISLFRCQQRKNGFSLFRTFFLGVPLLSWPGDFLQRLTATEAACLTTPQPFLTGTLNEIRARYKLVGFIDTDLCLHMSLVVLRMLVEGYSFLDSVHYCIRFSTPSPVPVPIRLGLLFPLSPLGTIPHAYSYASPAWSPLHPSFALISRITLPLL